MSTQRYAGRCNLYGLDVKAWKDDGGSVFLDISKADEIKLLGILCKKYPERVVPGDDATRNNIARAIYQHSDPLGEHINWERRDYQLRRQYTEAAEAAIRLMRMRVGTGDVGITPDGKKPDVAEAAPKQGILDEVKLAATISEAVKASMKSLLESVLDGTGKVDLHAAYRNYLLYEWLKNSLTKR